MNHYEEKQEARRERYEARADAARGEATRRYNAAMNVARNLQGEPIKVGHHSERGHRALLKRMDNDMRKSCEADRKAAHYDSKAAGVGMGGISSDDPDAPAKLKERIESAQASQQYMKDVNAAWRKAKKPSPDDAAGWEKVAATLKTPVDEFDTIRRSMRFDPLNRGPFAGYALSNNTANIKRMQKRLEELEAAAKAETKEHDIKGVRVVENAEANRLQLFFPGKPSDEIRTLLKQHGFRWARTEGAWQRHLNGSARYAAQCVLAKV